MNGDLVTTLTNPTIIFSGLVAIAVFATIYSLILPYFDQGGLEKRMKSVTTEREQIRSRERSRLNAESSQKASLRHQNNTSIRQIVERLNHDIVAILKTDDMKARLARIGAQPAPTTPEQFAALIQKELKKYAQIVKVSGAKVD